MPNPYYCPLIEYQLTYRSNDKVSFCCQFDDLFDIDQFDKQLNLYKNEMYQGKKIEPCKSCWRDEEQGFRSLRQTSIDDFKKYDDCSGLMSLDIRISNECNLACSMCSEHASTLWGNLKKINNTEILSSEKQNYLLEKSKNLRKLSIQGGEPFYGNHFIDFVNRISNKKQIELEIFTNTVTVDLDRLEKWSIEFEKVHLICSVDGTDKVYENIRWPTSWKKLNTKLKKIYELNLKYDNLVCDFAFTLQNLNLLDLNNFFIWRNENFQQMKINISILNYPYHFHFLVINNDERLQALHILPNIQTLYDKEKETILNIINLLQSTPLRKELLEQKKQSLEYIKNLRENYQK